MSAATAAGVVRRKSANDEVSPSVECLARAVLRSLGIEDDAAKNGDDEGRDDDDAALRRLEGLLELDLPPLPLPPDGGTDGDDASAAVSSSGGISSKEKSAASDVWVPSFDPPSSSAAIFDSTDNNGGAYERTLLEEYAPLDDRVGFYRSVAALLSEAFKPGSTVTQSNGGIVGGGASSIIGGMAVSDEEGDLLRYSLPRMHPAVRCARILDALLALEDCFSLDRLLRAAETSAGGDGSIPLMQSFLHHLSNLPSLEGDVHALQRKSRNLSSIVGGGRVGGPGTANTQAYGSAVARRLARAESFASRTDGELSVHVRLVASDILTTMYRRSSPDGRRSLRRRIGGMLTNLATTASVGGGGGNGPASGGQQQQLSLYGRNASAAGVSDLLHTLLRIVSGFSAPPLKPSHVSLLFDVLVPLHRPKGMVLWRDQTPLLDLYHEPLVACVSKILEYDDAEKQLLPRVILGLLHPDIWPEGRSSNTPKVVLLIHEIDTLIRRHLTADDDADVFRQFATPLVLRLCECIRGDNSRTAEVALQLWKGPTFDALIAGQLGTVLGPLMRALCRSENGMEPSWNPTVNKMTALVLGKLEGHDPELFARTANELFGGDGDGDGGGDGVTASGAGRDGAGSAGAEALHLQTGDGADGLPPATTETGTDVSGMISLKGAMGGWKPPPRRRPGTKSSSSSSRGGGGGGGMQPPSTVTGVAPWAAAGGVGGGGAAAGKGPGRRANPPLGVTGVAPWATTAKSSSSSRGRGGGSATAPPRLPPPPLSGTGGAGPSGAGGDASLPRPDKRRIVASSGRHHGSAATIEKQAEVGSSRRQRVASEGSSSTGADPLPAVGGGNLGITRVRDFLKRIQPPATSDDDGASHGGGADGMSSWALAQLSESPTLLPSLKFHDLVFGQDLGSGAFSTVRYARRIVKDKTRSNWPEFAVKIISTQKIMELGYEASVNREIGILRTLSHPGIARLISSFRFHDGAYLVLEYASGGDLYELLRRQGSLDHDSTRFVIGEVVAALRSVHESGFVYGDLKPENILICESGHVKLTDFGACRAVTEAAKASIKSSGHNALRQLRDGDWRTNSTVNNSSPAHVKEKIMEIGSGGYEAILEGNEYEELDADTRIEGTTAYLPPEVAVGGIPSPAADSWALGCVLYQCISGKPPLLEDSDALTRHSIVTFELPGQDDEELFFGQSHATTFRPGAKALIRRLLCRNDRDRPDMLLVGEDIYFDGMDVFSLFKRPAPQLIVGDVGPARDAKWSRRQFSSIWAPQPHAYSLTVSDGTKGSGMRETKINEAIQEGAEGEAYFVSMQRAVPTLSRIVESNLSQKD